MESNYNRELDEFFRPSGSPNVAFNQDDEDRVVGLILEFGSSYPSEIARHLLLRVEQVNVIIIKLINKEILVRIIPDPFYPQFLMKSSIGRLWNIGISEYLNFTKRSWVIVTEKGFWYYVDKFKGEHRRANVNYLNQYPNLALIYKLSNDDKISEALHAN